MLRYLLLLRDEPSHPAKYLWKYWETAQKLERKTAIVCFIFQGNNQKTQYITKTTNFNVFYVINLVKKQKSSKQVENSNNDLQNQPSFLYRKIIWPYVINKCIVYFLLISGVLKKMPNYVKLGGNIWNFNQRRKKGGANLFNLIQYLGSRSRIQLSNSARFHHSSA